MIKSLIFRQKVERKSLNLITGLSNLQTRRSRTKGRAAYRNPAMRAYPSFVGLKPASQASSHCKKSNKSRGTKHELLLRRELHRLGLDFRCNVTSVPGKPDIVFPRKKIAVFCDGDFWHGRDWHLLRIGLRRGVNGEYWVSKIWSNKKRDRKHTFLLRGMGWIVLRFWEGEIMANPQKVVNKVNMILQSSRSR